MVGKTRSSSSAEKVGNLEGSCANFEVYLDADVSMNELIDYDKSFESEI